jgi:nitrite reductase/ring-hydroxylating ferredoxin subunit
VYPIWQSSFVKVSGIQTIPRRAMSTGAVHALLNTVGLGLNVLSAVLRKNESRGAGILLSAFASSILFASAWLGGEMTYKYKVGVNKTPKSPKPENWHPTIQELDLPEMTPKRVEVEGSPILLYRYQGQIHAIGAVCSHDSGPLDEGSFEEHCVTCPWHHSVFDLRDGSVVHGPATYASPSFEVRVQQGRIEVRLVEKPVNEEAVRLVNQMA